MRGHLSFLEGGPPRTEAAGCAFWANPCDKRLRFLPTALVLSQARGCGSSTQTRPPVPRAGPLLLGSGPESLPDQVAPLCWARGGAPARGHGLLGRPCARDPTTAQPPPCSGPWVGLWTGEREEAGICGAPSVRTFTLSRRFANPRGCHPSLADETPELRDLQWLCPQQGERAGQSPGTVHSDTTRPHGSTGRPAGLLAS